MPQNRELLEKIERLKALNNGSTPKEAPATAPAETPAPAAGKLRASLRAAKKATDVPVLPEILREEHPVAPPPPALAKEALQAKAAEAQSAQDLPPWQLDAIPTLTEVLEDPTEEVDLPADIDGAFEQHFLRPQALRDGPEMPAENRPEAWDESNPLVAATARLQAELSQALTRALNEALSRFNTEAAMISLRILQETRDALAAKAASDRTDQV